MRHEEEKIDKLNNKYGFQAHLSPEFPSQIVVGVTEHCNLACIHCPHEEFEQSGIYEGRHLSTDLNKKLVDEVAVHGKGICKFLRYSAQGDPLIHPNIIEMVRYAGKHSCTSINITTNGKILDENMAKSLLDGGVNIFDISIDATSPETYAKIRKKGDFNSTHSNVMRLIDLINKGSYECKVVVSFVEQPLNENETDNFEKYWKNEGATYVVIRRMHSCAGANEDVAEEMRDKYKDRKPCIYPWERLVLGPTGKVGFCPADWKNEAIIADFAKNTIKEIWKSEFMQKLRKAHLNIDFSQYPFCDQCPDWAAMRWPSEGRAYSNMMQELTPTDVIDEEKYIKVGMIQSNYLPWRGYFDFIDDVDLFIFYDDVQYTRRDWRNRNKIKTDKGLMWLTVPVIYSQNDVINIKDAEIDYNQRWVTKHINSIKQAYYKTPFFKDYFEQLSEILHVKYENISELNISLIKWLMKQLNINTELRMSHEFRPVGSKTDRIIDILGKVKADDYLVGPAAKNYIDVKLFKDAGIGLEYKVYEYEEYPQLLSGFEPHLSVLDLLFNCGKGSRKHLKSLGSNEKVC